MKRSRSKFSRRKTTTLHISMRGNRAKSIVESDEFYGRLSKVYDGIFDQMPNDRHYQLLHLGYSMFFNADDEITWCNGESFGKFGLGSKPKLTLELRKKLNKLTEHLNAKLHV